MRLSLLFILLSNFSFSQLVLNNGIIVNVNGGTSNSASATIVLNNPPATPITRAGTSTSSGGVMLESEWNRIQYNLSSNTTAITIPYVSNATGSWVQFPLTMRNVTAGTNSAGKTGAIRFSSSHAGTMSSGYDNTAYMPSKVLNMNGSGCAGNNSANAVDRFWIIEPVYYSAIPSVVLDFTYIMGETDVNGGNTSGLAALLQPQRYDTTVAAACAWNGFPSTPAEMGTNSPAGSITATSVGTLTNVTVAGTTFFPDWTLANYLLPLPVEIIRFTGVCENKNVTLKWTSAHETNSSYYTLEKSYDAINFSVLATVNAVGNSIQNTNYTYVDVSPAEHATTYYRLSETDLNGTKKIFQTIAVTDCNTSKTENGSIYSYNGEISVNIFSLSNQAVTVTAYDVTGRLIMQNQLYASEGNNSLKFNPGLAQGVYLFELKSSELTLVKRILINE
jgi:hypothetical protein